MDKDKEKRISEVWCEYQQRMMMSNGGCGSMVLAAVVVMVVLAVMTGCKQVEYVAVPQQHTDTLIITKHQRDSIFLKDSTHVSEKGDTIRIEKWHTKFVEREVHDTLYQAKSDTIPQPYPVTEYVEKPLGWWQKGLIWIGIIALMVMIVIVVLKLKKFLPIR
jgi:hypothetical protein